jgi:hypothetical protein
VAKRYPTLLAVDHLVVKIERLIRERLLRFLRSYAVPRDMGYVCPVPVKPRFASHTPKYTYEICIFSRAMEDGTAFRVYDGLLLEMLGDKCRERTGERTGSD